MVRVLQNPYWLRKWIIQEVYLSGPTAEIVTCHPDHWMTTIPITSIARGVSRVLTLFFFETTAYEPRWEYHMGDYRKYPGLARDCSPFKQYEAPRPAGPSTTEEALDAPQLWSFRRFIGYDQTIGMFRYTSVTGLPYFWETLTKATMTYRSQPLISLTDHFRYHPCSLQYDNVYALLGLSNLRSGAIKIDYSSRVEDVARTVWEAVKDDFDGHVFDYCLLHTLGINDRKNIDFRPPLSGDEVVTEHQVHHREESVASRSLSNEREVAGKRRSEGALRKLKLWWKEKTQADT